MALNIPPFCGVEVSEDVEWANWVHEAAGDTRVGDPAVLDYVAVDAAGYVAELVGNCVSF